MTTGVFEDGALLTQTSWKHCSNRPGARLTWQKSREAAAGRLVICVCLSVSQLVCLCPSFSRPLHQEESVGINHTSSRCLQPSHKISANSYRMIKCSNHDGGFVSLSFTLFLLRVMFPDEERTTVTQAPWPGPRLKASC